jgi:hypothetical protein
MAFLALRHAAQYGERARILYIRQTYKGLSDFEEITRELFGRIYGGAARFNQTDGVWRLPGGGYFELGQLEGPGDYTRYRERSTTPFCARDPRNANDLDSKSQDHAADAARYAVLRRDHVEFKSRTFEV